MVDIPTLETERLRLRAPRLEDFPAFARFRASDRTAFLGGPCGEGQAFEKLGEIIGHWSLRGFGRWMIADKATDAPMGVAGLYHPIDWPEPEIAYSVFEEAEGKGIAFEAAMASRAYAYDSLGWTTAISLILRGNARSAALAERMGAAFESDHDHPEFGAVQIYRHPGPEAL